MRSVLSLIGSLTIAAVAASALAGTEKVQVVPWSKCGRPPPAGGWQCVARQAPLGQGTRPLMKTQFVFHKITYTWINGGKTTSDDWLTP